MYKHSRNEEWNIHSDSYRSRDKPISQESTQESAYTENKYQQDSGHGSDYFRKQEELDKIKEEQDPDNIDSRLDEKETKNKESKDYTSHNAITGNLNLQQRQNESKGQAKKKNIKNIEDAIDKAIKEEKEVIVLD